MWRNCSNCWFFCCHRKLFVGGIAWETSEGNNAYLSFSFLVSCLLDYRFSWFMREWMLLPIISVYAHLFRCVSLCCMLDYPLVWTRVKMTLSLLHEFGIFVIEISWCVWECVATPRIANPLHSQYSPSILILEIKACVPSTFSCYGKYACGCLYSTLV